MLNERFLFFCILSGFGTTAISFFFIQLGYLGVFILLPTLPGLIFGLTVSYCFNQVPFPRKLLFTIISFIAYFIPAYFVLTGRTFLTLEKYIIVFSVIGIAVMVFCFHNLIVRLKNLLLSLGIACSGAFLSGFLISLFLNTAGQGEGQGHFFVSYFISIIIFFFWNISFAFAMIFPKTEDQKEVIE